MFRKIGDFSMVYKITMDITIKLYQVLTDESLSQKVCDDQRTLGKIAWHNVLSQSQLAKGLGLESDFISESAPLPKSVKEINNLLISEIEKVLKAVTEKFNDENMTDEVSIFGMKMPVGAWLHFAIIHNVHHRGQMTILMRQANLKIPGVCGPSKEEWGLFGMPAKD
jgi:uncharacterized damage-inducible protein DinB